MKHLLCLCPVFLLTLEPILAEKPFFENRVQLLEAKNLGLAENKVPIYHGRKLIHGQRHEAIEGHFRLGTRRNYPLLFADLVANGRLQLTYAKRNGRSGRLGTSVATSPAYRTTQTLDLLPDINRVTVYAKGIREDYRSKITASFPGAASIALEHGIEGLQVGRTRFKLETRFTTVADIALARGEEVVANDRFRVLTLSSMFADNERFDANQIRYEALGGAVATLNLRNSTTRDQRLFPRALPVGSWIELVKGRGSSWNPDGPTIRVEIKNPGGLQLGIQGFLAASTDPNFDSLAVWLEWIDAPDTIPSGTELDLEFEAVATPPL
ncbi:MAG: hypothetical protein B9S36_04185 [Verrucomicrobiia bacterium Tous-C2TDCM]|nr:MAG: hypothetical protein B9S36_04185 [Verrucomicrobiae bacterium Tous-C2TDCM]